MNYQQKKHKKEMIKQLFLESWREGTFSKQEEITTKGALHKASFFFEQKISVEKNVVQSLLKEKRFVNNFKKFSFFF